MKTFRQLYCEREKIDPAQFDETVFRRSLYPQAWLARGLLRLWNSDYFLPDYDFVNGVGGLAFHSDFRTELSEYYYHPRNRGFLRRVLRLRVSAERLRRQFEQEITS
ncbi:hypothetical protein [Oleiharenicola lentus]|uniref:hypothetical protein n=1 Tax=Oleiharenicola lentus TaxID=2508720 RepID=UPI003F6796C9